MGSYILYKSTEKYVAHLNDIPTEVKKFLEYNKGNYVDDEDTLKDYFEDNIKDFKIVDKWFKDNDLYGYDLRIRYD